MSPLSTCSCGAVQAVSMPLWVLVNAFLNEGIGNRCSCCSQIHFVSKDGDLALE
jgi:hypothetical protein